MLIAADPGVVLGLALTVVAVKDRAKQPLPTERRQRYVKRLLVALLVAAVTAIVVGARLVHVHDTYGVWQLTSTETPNRIAASGRDYDRNELQPATSVPTSVDTRGKTGSGTAILAPNRARMAVPVVIYLRDDEGRFWSYSLVGGP
ncbi:hypothetical protein H7344_04540 [Nocardioides deserti]|uniref:Uncharacterized protein n=1 Tax=Nocardioides deserti TaxID=1588644 RepID=A0ABR6U548_9ACTN|nr:hypothetical protein [Nocardioides deserti]GGO73891.1 hypothetical protein GCM10012276_20590 [Nocardioides deserti]